MSTYGIGEVIHHRRYEYRGVVVSIDPRCLAEDSWYEKNRTQPRRDQPWYHVLVDGGQQTYVAEENLERDDQASPVSHPLVERLFPTFHNGRYYRESFN